MRSEELTAFAQQLYSAVTLRLPSDSDATCDDQETATDLSSRAVCAAFLEASGEIFRERVRSGFIVCSSALLLLPFEIMLDPRYHALKALHVGLSERDSIVTLTNDCCVTGHLLVASQTLQGFELGSQTALRTAKLLRRSLLRVATPPRQVE